MRAARACLVSSGQALACPFSAAAPRTRPQFAEPERHYTQLSGRGAYRIADATSSLRRCGTRRLSATAAGGAESAATTEDEAPLWPPSSAANQKLNDAASSVLADQRRSPENAHESPIAAQDGSGNARQASRFSTRSPRQVVASSKPERKHKPFSPQLWAKAKTARGNYLQWSYIRHQHSQEELPAVKALFKAWKSSFARIQRGSEPLLALPSSEERISGIIELEEVSAMKETWQAIEAEVRSRYWPALMLATLHLYPDKATAVLDATLDASVPGYAIHDVLLFASRQLRFDSSRSARERTIAAEEVVELFSKIMFTLPKGHVRLSQRIFGLYAKELPGAATYELYQMMQRSGYKAHPNTVIQFASNLSKSEEHKQCAFEILKDLVEGGIDLNEARPSSVITSLLHCKMLDSAQGQEPAAQDFSPKEALHYFIEKGVTLNVITATAFLDSLCQSGEVGEAIRLALLFAENDVRLDNKAWATVFRGAKGSLSVDNVARALDVAKVADVAYGDVLSNALHAVFYFAEAEKREKREKERGLGNPEMLLFDTMLRIYAKKFDLEQLQWWLPESLPLRLAHTADSQGVVQHGGWRESGWEYEATIAPFVDKLFSTGEDTKLRPSLTLIATMMRAYIRSLKEPYELISFYNFFKLRLQEQSQDENIPSAWRLVKNQGSLIHDTVIFSMTEHFELSRAALEVFGDMLKDQRQAGGDSKRPASSSLPRDDGLKAGAQTSASLRPIREQAREAIESPRASSVHPAPTMLTFTILLRGLNRNRDRLLADQVFQILQEQGMEPNLATWNTLIYGHASLQDVGKTVSTLQDMEAAGVKPDSYTFKAFGKLRNQSRALAMMEKVIDKAQRQIATEEELGHTSV